VVNELGDYTTLNKKYKKRFSMKSGLTGLAQVKGRNDISWDEKVTYDNQYIDLFNRYGVLIDFKLIFLSVIKVFKKDEIYEAKVNDNLSDVEAAQFAEEEIIRIAHLPD
jgi:lipopolysaccharide/colanic/teichoic acid biosynthesis glycosyltransferase